MAACASRAAFERRQLVEKVVIVDALQECDHVGMRADRVGDVQEGQAHLGGDVVGDGLRKGVGHVLLAEPLLQVLVEPSGGLHRQHGYLPAAWLEQDPLHLRQVLKDGVDQRRSGLRLDVAPQGCDRRPVGGDELVNDCRIGLDRVGGREESWHRTVLGDKRDEVALDDGAECVPDQRIRLLEYGDEAVAVGGRCEVVADVDEQTTTGRVHGCRRGQLPERDSEGLHGIGHHLLVADGHVHVGAVVGRGGDGEQRRDRSALHDVEGAVDQAPLDVLGSPEVRLDPPTQSRQLDYLGVRERRLRLPGRVDRDVLRASSGSASIASCFEATIFWTISSSRTLNMSGLTRPDTSASPRPKLASTDCNLPVAGDRVGREQDAGRLRDDHLLQHHCHVHLTMVDAVAQAIGDRALGEERSPAPADVFEDRRRPHNVQERVLLASEGCGGQVLCRRARPNRVGNVLVEPRHLADDRRGQIVRHRDRFDGLAELRGARADPVVGRRGPAASADRALRRPQTRSP